MDTKKLDLTKPVQTGDGRPVRILCTDKQGTAYPIVGLITEDNREHLVCWPPDGNSGGSWREDDLVNVPPPKQVMYFNVYKCGVVGRGFATRKRADQCQQIDRIACVRAEFTEGQFDE